MNTRMLILLLVATIAIIPVGWFSKIYSGYFEILRILILLAFFTASAWIIDSETKKRKISEVALGKLKHAYNELDEQAKLIVKTDLQLNKTQQELDKKITGLYTLHELGRTMNMTFDVEELFNSVKESFIQKLGFEKFLVILSGEEEENLKCQRAIGYSEEKFNLIKKHVEEDEIFRIILRDGKAMLAERPETMTPSETKLSELLNMRTFIVVPIYIKEVVAGIAIVGNESLYSRVNEGDIELISILANQIAQSIENSRLYEQLWRSYQELEVRVKERTKELAHANEELKKLNELKSEFVASVAHELRTPLTSIKGYASILASGRMGDMSPEQKERLERIDRHSGELAKLINDLLDISRIESGKVGMDVKEIALSDFFKNILELISPQAEENDIEIKFEIPKGISAIYADNDHIRRVFINLLSNALKFTPPKGKISVIMKDEKDFIQTDISDTGIGIAPEDISNIFREFFRADNSINREKKGTGLGLSLCKKIVEAHKGRIWLNSTPNQGTTFSFTLPKKQGTPVIK